MKSLTIMSLITAILLISCNPSKQASRKVRKAYQLSPGQVAEFCALQYPASIKDGDTITKIEYDFIEVECPPIKEPTDIEKDTVYITKKGSIIAGPTKIKVRTEIVTKYVTKYVKDSAQLASLGSQLKSCNDESKEWSKKLDKRNNFLLWLIIALALSTIINIIQARQ